ncbi:HIRAN domain-containing protein [Sphingomonas sp. 1P06PA]|uniref:HIRAN domain-containing protein n=1 Tax=Sphingomonas sp. 1P06PA TaxID=554121 RepID=UPI0039A448AB
MSGFNIGVVGGSHRNADGAHRQAEIARCVPGEVIFLRREPSNPFDPAAVAVFSCRNVQVGYISRERCGWIGSKIDRGYKVKACVERINFRDLPGELLKLVIVVTMDGEEPVAGRGVIADRLPRPRPALIVKHAHPKSGTALGPQIG